MRRTFGFFKTLPPYSLAGIALVIISECLMFAGVEPFATWHTPIAWWGYILFVDGVVFSVKGSSLIKNYFADFALITLLSVPMWLIFEAYNLLLKNWFYAGLPENYLIRYAGYFVSFASILPALVETADLLKALGLARPKNSKKLPVPEWLLYALAAIGALFLILPAVFPSPYLFAFVWLGFIFLLEPVNYIGGAPSLLRQIEEGNAETLMAFFIGGYWCGLLWEFWNFWAAGKWHYTVPILPEIKIFEMPVLGFLGFGPFALEMFAMYWTIMLVIKRKGYKI